MIDPDTCLITLKKSLENDTETEYPVSKSLFIQKHSQESQHRTRECSCSFKFGRVSDSGARGLGFETYLCSALSLSKTFYSPKVLVISRKRWLSPDMTEKLLTGTLI